MSNWFARTRRNLFFDFHTHSSAHDVLADFEPDRYAAQLQSMGVESVSAFAVDAFGWRYYRRGERGWIHPRLPASVDLLGDTLDACRRHGIRVIGYFNTMNSEPVAEHHPEWRELDEHGQPKSDYDVYHQMVICWLGDAVEQLFLPQIREVAANYDLDGLFFDGTYAHSTCYCSDCQRNFKADTGLELPLAPEDPHWQRWALWAEGRWEQIRRSMIQAIHTERPETLVCFNWAHTTRRPQPVEDGVGFLSLDLFPQDQVGDGSYQAKWWSAGSTPFAIMNAGFLRWWGDWGLKPTVALQQEVAAAVANGARTWIGYQFEPQHRLQPGTAKAFADTLAFVHERQSWLPEPAEIVADVAVLHSSTTYAQRQPQIFTDATLADQFPVGTYQVGKPEIFADERGTRGAHRMLLEAGLTHQILHEQLLLERLDDYRVVVLPDQRHVPEALVERLGPWVEAGGTLIASYRTATLNADMQPLTRPALESLLGISLDGDYPHDHVYVDVPDGALGDDLPELPMLVWAPSTLITPTEAEVVADLRAIYVRDDGQPLLRSSPPGEALGRPAITRHQVGAGNAIYVAPEAFSAYTRRGQWMLMQVLARLIVQGVGTPIAQVDRPDVEVVLARRAGTLLLQLVNRVVPMAQGSANAFSQRVMPLTDVAVHVALDRAPSGVTWQPQGHELSATWQDGVCQVVVPQLCIHGVVEIAS